MEDDIPEMEIGVRRGVRFIIDRKDIEGGEAAAIRGTHSGRTLVIFDEATDFSEEDERRIFEEAPEDRELMRKFWNIAWEKPRRLWPEQLTVEMCQKVVEDMKAARLDAADILKNFDKDSEAFKKARERGQACAGLNAVAHAMNAISSDAADETKRTLTAAGEECERTVYDPYQASQRPPARLWNEMADWLAAAEFNEGLASTTTNKIDTESTAPPTKPKKSYYDFATGKLR